MYVTYNMWYIIPYMKYSMIFLIHFQDYLVEVMCTNVEFNFKTLQWSDQLLMEQPDFIQKWTSKFGFFWDIWEGNFPYQPFIPVIATVGYKNTGKYSILPPDELRRPDTIIFDSITDNCFQRHFVCHNNSIFQYRTFQGSNDKVSNERQFYILKN